MASEIVPGSDRCERSRQAGREVLTDGLRLEGGGRAALAFTFTVNGGHLDLVGGLGLQANDDKFGGICQTEDTRKADNVKNLALLKRHEASLTVREKKRRRSGGLDPPPCLK